jgi:hypothetical protein
MTGRSRLPGGEPRKASQRNKRNVGSTLTRISPVWQASTPRRCCGKTGRVSFRRHVDDGEHAEVLTDGCMYRVRISELR